MDDVRAEAFYARTSGSSQDEQLQFDAAATYLSKNPHIKIFVDRGVSASKLKLDERPQLVALMNQIRTGNIGKLYVYHRDRICRDPFEYPIVINLFQEFDVEVIFTASATVPYSKDFVVEALFGMLAFQEAKHIQMRLNDAKKQNPPKIAGYKKEKNDSRNVYKLDPITSKIIESLFKEIAAVSDERELQNILIKYKKALKKPDMHSILRILKNPFYAARFEHNDRLIELDYVDVLVDLPLWDRTNKNLLEYSKGIQSLLKKTEPIFNEIICSLCFQRMHANHDLMNTKLVCSHRHKKNELEVKVLNDLVLTEMLRYISGMNKGVIKNHCVTEVKKQISVVENELIVNRKRLDILCSEICQMTIEITESQRIPNGFKQRFNEQEEAQRQLINRLQSLKEIIHELNLFISYGEQIELENPNQDLMTDISKLIIKQICISPNEIDIHVYFHDFFSEKGVINE